MTDTTSSWLARLAAGGVLAERVLDPGAWLNDPHIVASRAALAVPTDGVGTVYVPRTPGAPETSDRNLSPSPVRGQHNVQVLAELGMDRSAIDRLIASGVVHPPAGDRKSDV